VKTLNAGAAALQVRALAGEPIPVVPLVYFGTTVPQRWAVCGIALVYGGYTWEPLDIAVAEIRDDATQYSGLRFTLPAATDVQLALAIAGDVEGSPVTVHFAWVDPTTGAVADAMQVWAGELDVAGWQDGPEAVAQFTAEHRAGLAMRSRVSRYTNDEQQRLSPGDTSLDVDPLTDAAPLVWPAASFFKV
jgi:hypothetical protein